MKSLKIQFGFLICLAFALVAPTTAKAEAQFETDNLRAAADKAVAIATESLAKTTFKDLRQVAVIPLRNDPDGYVTSAVKSGVTRTPYALFARDDDEWNKLLGEIEWGTKREDIMDPATVQKFGKIKGVDAIMFGQVWDRDLNLWSIRSKVKFTVQLAEVQTGRILWSSGPVEAESYIHWSDALTQFWRFPALVLGVLALFFFMIVVLFVLRRQFRPL